MIIIGRTDKIDLPNLDLFDIECKIDTGAYGNALHCHHIKVTESEGDRILSFRVLDPSHQEYADKTYYCREFSHKVVKSSSG
ncbi:MAG: peptidase, partial [Cyclobacteriaceae bacterium]